MLRLGHTRNTLKKTRNHRTVTSECFTLSDTVRREKYFFLCLKGNNTYGASRDRREALLAEQFAAHEMSAVSMLATVNISFVPSAPSSLSGKSPSLRGSMNITQHEGNSPVPQRPHAVDTICHIYAHVHTQIDKHPGVWCLCIILTAPGAALGLGVVMKRRQG